MLRRPFALVLAAAMLCLGLPMAPAAAGPPGSATVVPIQVTGTPETRFNLVILGDGYTEAELPKFRAEVDKHLNVMWSIEPYKSYRSYMNVYAVEIVSADSGVDCDPDLTSPRRDTPLNMGFWGGCNAASVRRLLTVSSTAANTYADLVAGTTSANRQLLALGNSATYGGAGGSYATASGGNALSALISPHELGHSLGGLDDEYDYYGRGAPGGTNIGEPPSEHHTTLTEDQMRTTQLKWWRWLGEPSEAGGVIGRYEGGLYYSRGVWRPSAHSIMKTLGYYYDQVGREIMTQKIAGKVSLIQASTPTDETVAADRVLWVETLHPVSHELDVTWTVDGAVVPGTQNRRELDLATLGLLPGPHAVTATVVDPTEFVRDPAIRGSAALTVARTWDVLNIPLTTTPPESTPVAITSSTPTTGPVAADSVVYVEPAHPTDHVFDITWRLDGVVVDNPGNARDLDLATLALSHGSHVLSATVSDPANSGAGSSAVQWAIDATQPTTTFELSPPATTLTRAGEPTEYVFGGPFRMELHGSDDTTGYVVTEYRVNGDGWQNYYGWPTDSEAGMLFTEFGTNIDDLIYGKLGTPRLSPWDVVPSGQGRHTIEYRAIDAAGNIASAQRFVVTLDLTAPVIAIAHAPDGTGGWNLGESVTVDITASDTIAGVGTVTCTDGEGALPVTPSGSGTWTATVTGDGTHEVTCTVVDLAGNSAAASDTVRIDSTAPVLHVPAPIVVKKLPPGGATVTYDVTATDAVDPAPTVECTPPSGSIFPPKSTTTVVCTARDAAGNAASDTFTVTTKAAKRY